MKKLDKYNVCPSCGGTLRYIGDVYDLVSYKEQTVLSTDAECACGWKGVVLWQDPPYLGTVDVDELD